jgi:PAS domain S-box-containing protein
MGAYVALPLVAHGNALGALTLLDTSSTRSVDEEELEFLRTVADEVATGLDSARLHAAGLWLRTIFDQMADAVMVLDRDGRVVERNAAAEQLFGGPIPIGMTAANGRDLFDIRRPDGSPLPAAERPSAMALTNGEPVNNVDMVVVHPDGSQVELSASSAPLKDGQARVVGAVTVLREVTALRRLERAKDSFLSVASHELRTPLTPLKGLTQILLRQMERTQTSGTPMDLQRLERYLRTMDGQVDRLAGLVNDLLDVSRIKTGRMELRSAPTDLVALTRGAVERFRDVARVTIRPRSRGQAAAGPTQESTETGVGEGSYEIVFAPAARSLVVTCDRGRMEQVVNNLIANGLKYSPAGGQILVRLARRRTAGGPAAHLTVTDPGIGIPAAQMSELFRPFVRLANAPAEHFGGLGLGLYIAFDIVDRHGGRIWAESKGAGRGTTFHVELPLHPAPPVTPAAAAQRVAV